MLRTGHTDIYNTVAHVDDVIFMAHGGFNVKYNTTIGRSDAEIT